jgi:hypothetical protein
MRASIYAVGGLVRVASDLHILFYSIINIAG